MMRVQFLTRTGEHQAGEIADLPDHEAVRLIAAGMVRPMKMKEPLERAVIGEDHETAELQ